jgi:hypothetical protein
LNHHHAQACHGKLLEKSSHKKKIFLHIGHGKTGTSSIQSVLAKAQADLEAANILYPFDASFEDAKKGFISSGNIPPESIINWFEYCMMQVMQRQPNYNAYIFSSENLFWHMDQFFSEVENYREHFDFEIILSVRNPFDMLCSAYQQAVKRNGAAISFDEFLVEQDFLEFHAVQAVTILERLEALQVKVNLLNYTAIGRNIGSRILAALNINNLADCHMAENVTVNRSLDAAELQLLLLINFAFGAEAGAKVSDNLVNRLPSLSPAKLNFIEDSIVLIKSKMQPIVDQLNTRLPKSEQLNLHPSLCAAAHVACHDDVNRSHFLASDQAAIAYDVLVNYFKEVLGSASLNPEESMPVASLILFLFLGNASHSRLPINRQTYDVIIDECQVATCLSGLCESFDHNQLLGYLYYFSAGESAFLPQHLLISQQLNALSHAGLSPMEILDLFAVVHRVKLRVAVD